MPELPSVIPKQGKKRRIEEYADENDEDIIEITPVKRKRLDSHSVPEFFNNIFKKFSDWFKRTSQNNPRLFGVSTESNSAAAAIAHGGQYLEDASTDKFMPQKSVDRNGGRQFMNQTHSLMQQSQHSLPGVQAPNKVLSEHNQSSHQQSHGHAQGPLVNGEGLYEKVNNNGLSRSGCNRQNSNHKNSISQQSSGQVRGASGVSCSSATSVPSSLYSSTPSVKMGLQSTGAYQHNSSINYKHYDLESNLDHSHNSEQLNGTLQKSYVDHSVSAKSPTRHTVFDRTFSKSSDNVACFDLDEKERYKRLLQQFSVPVSDQTTTHDRRSVTLSRLSTRPTTSTLLDQSSFLLSSDRTPGSSSTMITAPSMLTRSQRSATDISLVQKNRTTDNNIHLSTAVRKISASQKYNNIIEPSAISKRCDSLVKRMMEIQDRSKAYIEEQKHLKAEEMKLAEWDKLREEEDEHLKRMVEQRLKLSAKVILEDLPPPDVPEYDEFPELSDEAEMMVRKALGSGPNDVLSDAFRIRISRNDMATLGGLNWLNDEVVNFYFNLIQDRSGKDDLPSVYVFNTFFYPKIMKDGHKSVRRWTKAVDIFSKDIILIPIHLGMHWCLACINIRDKEIQYFDSMGGNNHPCLSALKKYLEDESMDKKKQPFDTSDWTLNCVKDIPQQMNGSDCGVFSCKYAEYLSRNASFTFSQEHMPYFRRRMIYEILTKKLI